MATISDLLHIRQRREGGQATFEPTTLFPGLVRIVVPRNFKEKEPHPQATWGSGFFGGREGVVLTVRHNLTRGKSERLVEWVWICCYDPKTGGWTDCRQVTVDPDFADKEIDAALLLVPGATPKVLELSDGSGRDHPVAVIGFGNPSEPPFVSKCKVAGIWSEDDHRIEVSDGSKREKSLRLQFTTEGIYDEQIRKGFSGGPVIDVELNPPRVIAIQKAIQPWDGIDPPYALANRISWLEPILGKLPEKLRVTVHCGDERERASTTLVKNLVKKLVYPRKFSVSQEVAPDWLCEPGKEETYKKLRNYVYEGGVTIEKLTRDAAEVLRTMSGNKYRSFVQAVDDGPDGIHLAAHAIYYHLRGLGIRYEAERTFNKVTGQGVRTPREILSLKKGTCLDLVLLFLSCLTNVKISPLAVQLVGTDTMHQIAAIWLDRNSLQLGGEYGPLITSKQILQEEFLKKSVLFIECTGFAEGYPCWKDGLDFDPATKEGEKVFNEESLLFALDIWKAWETWGKDQPWSEELQTTAERRRFKIALSVGLVVTFSVWLGVQNLRPPPVEEPASDGGAEEAPRILSVLLDGTDPTKCTGGSPCKLMSRKSFLVLKLESPGYAAVYVQDPYRNRYPQGEIARGTEFTFPVVFGGSGHFTVLVATSAELMQLGSGSPELPGDVQLQAFFDVQ